MAIPKAFKEVKRAVIAALRAGAFQHEARDQIDVKNLLQAGVVSAVEVEAIIRRCNGTEHRRSSHHQVKSVDVHVIVSQGWYIKFYFSGNPDTMFICVHH